MAKRKPRTESLDGKADGPRGRERVKYIAVSLALHNLLAQYARDHSNEDEKKSVSWAGRVILRKGFAAEGYPKKSGG